MPDQMRSEETRAETLSAEGASYTARQIPSPPLPNKKRCLQPGPFTIMEMNVDDVTDLRDSS